MRLWKLRMLVPIDNLKNMKTISANKPMLEQELKNIHINCETSIDWEFHAKSVSFFNGFLWGHKKRYLTIALRNSFDPYSNALIVRLFFRALTRAYRSRLTAPFELKLAEYFPNWVSPKFLNPIKLKNKYYCFFVHTRGYKLHFDYIIYWLQYCIKIPKTNLVL